MYKLPLRNKCIGYINIFQYVFRIVLHENTIKTIKQRDIITYPYSVYNLRVFKSLFAFEIAIDWKQLVRMHCSNKCKKFIRFNFNISNYVKYF